MCELPAIHMRPLVVDASLIRCIGIDANVASEPVVISTYMQCSSQDRIISMVIYMNEFVALSLSEVSRLRISNSHWLYVTHVG